MKADAFPWKVVSLGDLSGQSQMMTPSMGGAGLLGNSSLVDILLQKAKHPVELS